MELGFFLYSTVIIGIAIIICSVSLVVWLMTSRRDCLCAAAGFAFYAMSCALIFFDEYSREKYDYAEIFEQPLLHPVATTVLGVAVVACIWIWVLLRAHAQVGPKPVLALVVPAVVLVLTVIASLIPLAADEVADKIPMLIGFLVLLLLGEVVRIWSARGRTEYYAGLTPELAAQRLAEEAAAAEAETAA